MSGPDDAGLVERLLDNAWGLNVADTLGKRDADRAEAAAVLQSQAAEIARLRGALKMIAFLRPCGDVATAPNTRALVQRIECIALEALAQQGGDDG